MKIKIILKRKQQQKKNAQQISRAKIKAFDKPTKKIMKN